jgi:hypothetical protein
MYAQRGRPIRQSLLGRFDRGSAVRRGCERPCRRDPLARLVPGPSARTGMGLRDQFRSWCDAGAFSLGQTGPEYRCAKVRTVTRCQRGSVCCTVSEILSVTAGVSREYPRERAREGHEPRVRTRLRCHIPLPLSMKQARSLSRRGLFPLVTGLPPPRLASCAWAATRC